MPLFDGRRLDDEVEIDMCTACMYPICMPKMIQLRNVPDSLHCQLKARAALEGMSLSDYLLREARKIAERPTVDEIKARLEALKPVHLRTSPTKLLRDERDRG